MSEFYIKPEPVKTSTSRLDTVEKTISAQARTIDDISNSLGSIGLAEVIPNVTALQLAVTKNSKSVNNLNTSLLQIINKYIQADASIQSSSSINIKGGQPTKDMASGKTTKANTPNANADSSSDNPYISYDDDGNVIIDMDKIAQTMSKDAGDITADEYNDVATAYQFMTPEQMSEFLSLFMTQTGHYDFNWTNVWTIDNEKLNNLIYALDCQQTAEFALMQSMDPTDVEGKAQIEALRQNNIQMSTVLKQLNTVSTFTTTSTPDGAVPVITVTSEKWDDNFNSLHLNVSEVSDAYDADWSSGEHGVETIIDCYIMEPQSGSLSDNAYFHAETYNAEQTVLQESSYHLEDAYSFLGDEIKDKALGCVKDTIGDYAKYVINNTLVSTPLGAVVDFAIDVGGEAYSQYEEYQAAVEDHQHAAENEAVDLFSDLDYDMCTVYDANNNTVSIDAYPTSNTEAYIATYNETHNTNYNSYTFADYINSNCADSHSTLQAEVTQMKTDTDPNIIMNTN